MEDTAQLAIFIRGVTVALQVYEEFLQLVPLHGTTAGQDTFDAVLQCVKQYSLDLFRLVCSVHPTHLALLTYIATHLNDLNVKLQGKNILVTHVFAHHRHRGKAARQFMHFPRIVAYAPNNVDLNTCVGVVNSLREEFASRFTGVRPLAPDFKLFNFPFDFPVDGASASMQMELVEYRFSTILLP